MFAAVRTRNITKTITKLVPLATVGHICPTPYLLSIKCCMKYGVNTMNGDSEGMWTKYVCINLNNRKRILYIQRCVTSAIESEDLNKVRTRQNFLVCWQWNCASHILITALLPRNKDILIVLDVNMVGLIVEDQPRISQFRENYKVGDNSKWQLSHWKERLICHRRYRNHLSRR